MSSLPRSGLLFAAVVVLCGACGGQPVATPIGDTDYIVDLPPPWTVEGDALPGSFKAHTADHHDFSASIVIWDGTPGRSLDEVRRSVKCAEPAKAVAMTTAAGAQFVQCPVIDTMLGRRPEKITMIRAELADGTRVVECVAMPEGDGDVLGAICKSLRKK